MIDLGSNKKFHSNSQLQSKLVQSNKDGGITPSFGRCQREVDFFVEDTVILFQVTRGSIVRSKKWEERKKLYGSIWADRWGGNFCGSFK